jgi:hypothetical protein
MRAGRHTYGWDTPMPTSPLRQRHESPKRGDNRGAIRRARGGAFDANVQGPFWMHWPEPRRNGYTRIIDRKTGRSRKMTRAELRRPWWNWEDADVARWRRPNGEHPLKDEEALILCAKYGAIPIREIKYPGAGTDPSWFARYVAHSKAHDVPAWFKTLPTMRGAEGKVRLCRAAGGQIALIYGKGIRGRLRRLAATRRVARTWAVKPDRTW